MRGTIILGGTLLLFHNILVIAVEFKINENEVQVWEVKIPPQLEAYSEESSYKLEELDILSNNKIPFGSGRTFILLKKFHPRWSISYWLGEGTTLNHKKATAAFAGKLWNQIIEYPKTELIRKLKSISVKAGLWYTSEVTGNSFILTPTTEPDTTTSTSSTSMLFLQLQPNDDIIPTINRETENNESYFFIFHYKKYGQLQSTVKTMDLYEIKLDRSQAPIISLIPLDSQKNEKENLYVLDKGGEIIHSASEKITNSKLTLTKQSLVYNLIHEKVSNQMMIRHTKIKGEDTINNYIETSEHDIRVSASESSSSTDEDTSFSRNKSTKETGESSRSIEDELAQILERATITNTEEEYENSSSIIDESRELYDIMNSEEEEDEDSSFIRGDSRALYDIMISEEEEDESSSFFADESGELSDIMNLEEKTIKLFKYDEHNKEPIRLQINNILEKNCYVLQNESIKHYYIYLGTESNLETIKEVLRTAEEAIEIHGWTMITFSTKAYVYTVDEIVKHPTVFWVNFNDYMNYFFKFIFPANNHYTDLINSLK